MCNITKSIFLFFNLRDYDYLPFIFLVNIQNLTIYKELIKIKMVKMHPIL